MYLIDGYNLLYQTDFPEKEGLINAVNEFCRTRRKTAIIIFDGRCPHDLNTNFVQVIFTGDADDGIARLIDKCDNPSMYVLVTSDKEIRYLARQKKIKCIKSEEFNFSASKPVPIDPDEQATFFMTDSEVKKQLKEFNNFENKNI